MRAAILAVLLVVGAVTFAAPPENFTDVIDFSISTADLVEIVQTGQYDRIDPTKYLLLQGSVASTAARQRGTNTQFSLPVLCGAGKKTIAEWFRLSGWR